MTFNLDAESSDDDDSTPDSDMLDKGMWSPILDGDCTHFTTEQRGALLSDMKQEMLQLQGEVMDKQKKGEEIARQVAEDLARIEKLQASIELATLCEFSTASHEKSRLASSGPAQLHLPSLEQDIHPESIGEASPACPLPDLTFSPSDQTLVEMGQITAVDAARSAATQNEDIMMLTVKDSAGTILETPRMPHDRETPGPCDTDLRSPDRSLRPRRHHGISSRKRRRLSGLFSVDPPTDANPTPAITSHGFPSASGPECEQDPSQRSCNPLMLRGRSRRAGILIEQLSAPPCGLERIGTREPGISRSDKERPVSFPQSQRWRKSLGVSVKTLTEGFERMRLKQRDTKTIQPT